ncbi:hypothetical protein BC827DRAFT_1271578 [Russula dissimulans]|nr:hypothetical protein BC827DRAFT_1271578 [Russula dissimulans]
MAINDGLAKLNKYYSWLDKKPTYILALALHPYFKLAYIKLAWGGLEEQEAECKVGNPLAKNWQDEAQKILEQMGHYYKSREITSVVLIPPPPGNLTNDITSILSKFDCHCLALLMSQEKGEGWQAELRRYLKTLPADVTKDTDIVEWWQVEEIDGKMREYQDLLVADREQMVWDKIGDEVVSID